MSTIEGARIKVACISYIPHHHPLKMGIQTKDTKKSTC